MTDVKAKHGGARPGSGRKPLQPILCDSMALITDEPRAFLMAVMNEPALDMRMRVDAAKLLLRTEARRSVKAGREDALERAMTGRFALRPPPAHLPSVSTRTDDA
jgi:hypothetical protein